MMSEVLPYHDLPDGKRKQVEQMFNNIAHRYDFLNHFLSMGIDKRWRKKVISELKKKQPANILDVATGTGDLAFASAKQLNAEVTGVDIAANMLSIAEEKKKKSLQAGKIKFLQADALSLPFTDGSFDACTIAFGVRNFENIEAGLKEINRVLKKNGVIAVLEFSTPPQFPVKQFYLFYFRYVLPAIGRFFSRDKRAYQYLPESVYAFPSPENFCGILHSCGFTKTWHRYLTFGIASLYTAHKN
ncbi:MAG: bifunctional demethylmenaquinone methyltransferase/2-methoxy-6-polyprenyl-1,4-benzoquinol methylase UbiE [Bacteroidia bacterium]|nr:bifunctional demethylmenaquinone methyltransferase/2-methoxy-6-polyprenyl-1,4-benzoquinol methylase UbiE [Bacteroidia bacterium]